MENDNEMLKAILGPEPEFAEAIFGKSVPVPTILAAPIPVIPGALPSSRPAGSSAKMRAEIRELIEDTFADLSTFDNQQLQSLVDAMEAYVRNQIR